MRAAALGLIRAYQLVDLAAASAGLPLLPELLALRRDRGPQEHGVVRGSWLALSRLARCHPWHPGGVDFVPAAAPHGARRLESR